MAYEDGIKISVPGRPKGIWLKQQELVSKDKNLTYSW